MIEQATIVMPDDSCTSQPNPIWNLDHIDPGDHWRNLIYEHDENGGENVVVYVLDTGVDVDHSGFGGRAEWGVTLCGGDLCTFNQDIEGHGTHVAGTVAADLFGVARNTIIVAVKVLNDTRYGTTSDLIAGINWAVWNSKSRSGKRAVINMSLGGDVSMAVDNAVDAATNDGVMVVVSAGNEDRDACLNSPASAPTAITVASHGKSLARSFFSNYGPCVNIFAPGELVISLEAGGALSDYDGTSMASPHVAGAVALYLSNNLNANHADVLAWLTTNAIPNVISDAELGTPNLMLQVPYCAPDALATTTTESPSPGSPKGCLHLSSSWVQMEGEGARALTDVRVGDRVLAWDMVSGGPRYSAVLALVHHYPNVAMDMVRIRWVTCGAAEATAQPKELILTKEHVVFACGSTNSSQCNRLSQFATKFASDLLPTDTIILHEGELGEVLTISVERLTGISNPVTATGTIVANGMLVTCYGDMRRPVPWHGLNIVLALVTSYCAPIVNLLVRADNVMLNNITDHIMHLIALAK